MAMNWNTAAGPSRQVQHPTRHASDDEPLNQEQNNRILQKAIGYLAREGGSDPTVTYIDRVQRIDEGIVREFRDRRYTYDPQLYRQLRSLVREVQADFESVAGEESTINSDDSDASMEELYSPEALYREDVDVDYEIAPTPNRGRRAEVLKTEFLYGGPNNDVEEWHKDFPAALPFGETLHMQRWEGMKINYDLAESAKKNPNVDDPLVNTNVPYAAVEARFGRPPHHLESGSRFNIPVKVWKKWDEVVDTARDMAGLEASIDEFNQGGDPQEQKDKDYAPRIFLPQISLDPMHQGPSSSKDRSRNVNEQHTPTPAPRRRFISGPKPAVKLPQTTALRNFDQRRQAVAKGTSTAVTKPNAPLPKKETPKPAPRTLRYAQADPSANRTPNHSRKPAIQTTRPTAKETIASSKARKRKASDDAYIPSPTSPPPAKKGKSTPAAQTKKAASAKKPVRFADDPTPSRPAPKQVPGAKKTPAKRKAKEAASVPEVLTKDVRAGAKSSLKRGTTRSGSKFK